MEDSTKTGVWRRFGKALSNTRGRLAGTVKNLIVTKGKLSQDALEELETALLVADVGGEATSEILQTLQKTLSRKQIRNTEGLIDSLSDLLVDRLEATGSAFELASGSPSVILVVGVNGVGKTTTVGKLTHLLKQKGSSVLLAAGDTYRAAAIEQLREWGNRTKTPVVAQQHGSDSASVIFDACSSARARDIDVVIADSAGRLHNKSGLMEELAKIRRVVQKFDENAPHEVLLVLDASSGQNAIAQAVEFQKTVSVSGIVVTKVDGTAKAGFAIPLVEQTKLPIYFMGLGEGMDDLQSFDARAYVNGMLVS